MVDIQKMVKEEEAKMIADRRYLHQHPELGFQEFETTNYLAAFLDDLGVTYRRLDPTGLVGELAGKRAGKTILLRADIDALPINEVKKDLPYASQTENVMHACGHDSHMAMLMTAIRVLNRLEGDFSGTVRFIFQPAEETGRGAKAMIKQGVLEGVDEAFGMHIWSQLPVGTVSCVEGPSFGAADFFTVTFEGKGGHGAQPHLSKDALIMGAHFATAVQTAVSRMVDPIESGVLTIGTFHSGQKQNVIAQTAELSGTVRTFYPDARDTIENAINDIANHTAQMFGGQATVQYDRLTTIVNNTPESAKRVRDIVDTQMPSADFVDTVKMMVGEDFGYFTDEVPGAFALVGSGNKEKDAHWPHHHERFDLDEDSFARGAELYVRYALDYLN
ncbi:metal-dependent amidase/aminoacylase/carboxypeptidase [Streptococcus acidominimus]|uniref:Metal-dependent amidase/aminoacylase/carboxypeptidase n=1 Tax=Streptococcus acidominimus TaxID=1326 RepID=A0A239WUV0_STRAI|nr:amidohydrolase [Streptococcus acidominimus]SNV38029.1 metal-dependent amidase/aminoacylase/carboxypeptidase [Streptococcus acidominimus]